MASFRELLKEVENSVQAGKTNGAWFPHKSAEGGTRTLGYGHKLTQQEEDGNYIVLPNGKVVDFDTRGLTDDEIDVLLDADVQKHKSIAATQWDAAQKTPFSSLSPIHQTILTELTFNVGSLKNSKGKFGWPSLAKGILSNDMDVVKKEIMRGYTNPKGKRVELTSRVNKIRDMIDQHQQDPQTVSLEGFSADGASPEEPQMAYSNLVNGLMQELTSMATPPSRQRERAPETPLRREPDKVEELMQLVDQDLAQESVRSRGERRLEQTYNEVLKEEEGEKEFSEEDERKIQELMELTAEPEVFVEQPEPEPRETDQPEERERDTSKDPIYGIF